MKILALLLLSSLIALCVIDASGVSGWDIANSQIMSRGPLNGDQSNAGAHQYTAYEIVSLSYFAGMAVATSKLTKTLAEDGLVSNSRLYETISDCNQAIKDFNKMIQIVFADNQTAINEMTQPEFSV